MGIHCSLCTTSHQYEQSKNLASHHDINLMDTPIIPDKEHYPLKFKIIPNNGNRIKDGFGIITWSNNSWYKGQFINNTSNGWGIFNHPLNGKYTGEYQNDVPYGYGLYKHISQSMYEGTWNDRQDGIGIELWTDFSSYKGEFVNGEKCGIGQYIFNNGNIYYGEWERNTMNGYGFYVYNHDTLYMGNWKDGLRDGYGEVYGKESVYFWGMFKGNKQDGFFLYYNKVNGKILVGFHTMGVLNGPVKIYKKDIENSNIYFVVNGKKDKQINSEELNVDECYKKYYNMEYSEISDYLSNKIKEIDKKKLLALLGKNTEMACCCL